MQKKQKILKIVLKVTFQCVIMIVQDAVSRRFAAHRGDRRLLFLRKECDSVKRRIAGIVLVVLSLGALGFWELWGRENITYDKVLVFKEALPKNTLITADMFRIKKVDNAGDGAIPADRMDEIVGLETVQFVPADTELYREYFQESIFAVGQEQGKYILSIPAQWLKAFPQTLRRGDRAFFYCGGESVTDAVVAYVRDGTNQEVYYGDDERLTSSSTVSLIEVVVDKEQAALLGKLAEKGNKFVILYY